MKDLTFPAESDELKDSKVKLNNLSNSKHKSSFGGNKVDIDLLEYKRQVNKLLSGEETVEKMEDARESKFYFEKMRCLELCRLMLMVMAMSVSILDYEIEFAGVNEYYAQWFLYITLVCSVLQIIMTYFSYSAKNQFIIATKQLGNHATIYNTGQWKNMLVEMSVYMVFPMPWFTGIKVYFFNEYHQIEVFHYLNEILLLVMLIRFLVMIKIVLINTKWYTERVNRVCNLYATKMDALFIVKVNMMLNPMKVFWFCYVVTLFILSYAIRICERPLIREETEATPQNYSYYPTAMWLMLISIPSVGYGDRFPTTLHGRFFAGVSFIAGTFMLSILCNSLIIILDISVLEQKALIILEKLKARQRIKNSAILLFTYIAKISSRKRRALPNMPELGRALQQEACIFKSYNRYYKSLADQSNLMEQIDKSFNYIREEIFNVDEKFKIISESHKVILTQAQNNQSDFKNAEQQSNSKTVLSQFDPKAKNKQNVQSVQYYSEDTDISIKEKPYNFCYNLVNHVHPNQFY